MDRHAPRVAVCVATYRRPEGLRALLKSLDALLFNGTAPHVEIIVVDNSPDAPATERLGTLDALSRWPLTYVIEPVRGIVAARNRALETVPAEVDFIAFLDDDEVVDPGWLSALLATSNKFGATAVQGPVIPDYEAPPKVWMEDLGIYRLGPFEDGAPRSSAATNNVLIDASFIRAQGLRFDPRFNITGGEDEEFFGRLKLKGGSIVASAEATVHDVIPAVRMTFSWAARRAFRKGNTLGRIALLRAKGRTMRLAKGFAGIGVGAGSALLLWPLSPTRAIAGALEFFRGAGTVAAFLNVRFPEYSAAAVAHDRSEVR